MKKVEFTLSIGFVGGVHRSTVEFDNDATDEEIEETYLDWRSNYLVGGWNVVEVTDDNED
jgi:hypothetical protein